MDLSTSTLPGLDKQRLQSEHLNVRQMLGRGSASFSRPTAMDREEKTEEFSLGLKQQWSETLYRSSEKL